MSPARKSQRPSITRCKFAYIDEAIKFILHLTRCAVHLPPPAIKLIKFLPVLLLPLWQLVAFVLLGPNLPYSFHCIANPGWISLPLLTQIALSERWVEENTGHVHGGLLGKLVILLEFEPSHVEARVEAWVTESPVFSLREVFMQEVHVGENFIECILPALAY